MRNIICSAVYWRRHIFPARLQTSIFGTEQLNYRVRNGYGWTLHVKNTNFLSCKKESKELLNSYRVESRTLAKHSLVYLPLRTVNTLGIIHQFCFFFPKATVKIAIH